MFTLVTCWAGQFNVSQHRTYKAAKDMFEASLSVDEKRGTLRGVFLYGSSGALRHLWVRS